MVTRIFKKKDIDRLYANVMADCKRWLKKKNTNAITRNMIMLFIANRFTTLAGLNWNRAMIDGLCDEMEEFGMIEFMCCADEDSYYMIDDFFD